MNHTGCYWQIADDKFYYPHPEALRRYLTQGVCGGCWAEAFCHSPCQAYWQWWDARMAVARKLACLGKNR